MKPVYRSIWWPRVHKILVWTPDSFQKVANSPNCFDVRDNMKRIQKLSNGRHTYSPSKAYKRKIAKMAEKGLLPTHIQNDI